MLDPAEIKYWLGALIEAIRRSAQLADDVELVKVIGPDEMYFLLGPYRLDCLSMMSGIGIEFRLIDEENKRMGVWGITDSTVRFFANEIREISPVSVAIEMKLGPGPVPGLNEEVKRRRSEKRVTQLLPTAQYLLEQVNDSRPHDLREPREP